MTTQIEAHQPLIDITTVSDWSAYRHDYDHQQMIFHSTLLTGVFSTHDSFSDIACRMHGELSMQPDDI
jgi:hypothetical protein